MDLGQAGVEVLLDEDVVGSSQHQAGHPQGLMEHLVDIERFALEALRIACRQNLLDQSGDAIDAVED